MNKQPSIHSHFKFFLLIGFSGCLLDWLTDFLIGRKQRVVLGENVSEWKDVMSGVPQGTVLGPLLFVIYINDMPDVVNNLTKLFADDTKLISTIKNRLDIELLQEDTNRLVNWAIEWRMLFNEDKCKFMFFNNKRYPELEPNLRLNGKPMERSYVEKDL